jgi:hypothetical protein
MNIKSWRAIYRSKRTGSKVIVPGFLSRSDAETFVAKTDTDIAIDISLGWTEFVEIVEHADSFDEHKYAEEMTLPHKTVLFGDAEDEFFKTVARIKGCELWVDEDHFDRFAVFKAHGDQFKFSRQPVQWV